ncbi:MAG: hypothetical protein NZ550_00435 [Fimbriimonadales bacterium]|nr:hypothetical protein [Fimbriimonadales bacterium]
MSMLSKIFAGYHRALDESQRQLRALRDERVENACSFYNDFFHKLIVQYEPFFQDPTQRRQIKELAEQVFDVTRLDKIDFVAIDGTCSKHTFREFVVFFGGAYGARGSIFLKDDPPRVKYERWGLERDVSLVAYVPVPFATIEDVYHADKEETFVVSDAHRVNLSNIHISLMQLAEVYLAYTLASATTHDYPRLIMMDMSLSGLMAAVSHGANTALAGYLYDRRALDDFDIKVAFAHPINQELGVPSAKRFGRHNAIIAQFHLRNTAEMPKDELRQRIGLSETDFERALAYLTRPDPNKPNSQPLFTERDGKLLTEDPNRFHPRHSWEYTISLFAHICKRLFTDKDPSALTYEAPDPDYPQYKRRRWMSPEDVNFLTAVGLRALIEKCWEKHILLVGIAKDSESAYLTRNYLGVMKHIGVYPELQALQVKPLPWTDRLFLESVPVCCDASLTAPWSTIEFDSVFMTLKLGLDENGRPQIMGTRARAGEIVSPERLFLRSLAQFFLSRGKRTPLCGHVVFVDRLALPRFDKQHILNGLVISTPNIGEVRPIVYKDNRTDNCVQRLMMYLLDVLTRNHFAEVIGYPDPLHKADWGAKTIGRKVREMLESSTIPFFNEPLTRTLRNLRNSSAR